MCWARFFVCALPSGFQARGCARQNVPEPLCRVIKQALPRGAAVRGGEAAPPQRARGGPAGRGRHDDPQREARGRARHAAQQPVAQRRARAVHRGDGHGVRGEGGHRHRHGERLVEQHHGPPVLPRGGEVAARVAPRARVRALQEAPAPPHHAPVRVRRVQRKGGPARARGVAALRRGAAVEPRGEGRLEHHRARARVGAHRRHHQRRAAGQPRHFLPRKGAQRVAARRGRRGRARGRQAPVGRGKQAARGAHKGGPGGKVGRAAHAERKRARGRPRDGNGQCCRSRGERGRESCRRNEGEQHRNEGPRPRRGSAAPREPVLLAARSARVDTRRTNSAF